MLKGVSFQNVRQTKEIKHIITESKTVLSNIGREDEVLTRLRIGHARFPRSWLLKREYQYLYMY